MKKITIMPHEQMEKISARICNIRIYSINVANMIPGPADSNGLVIIKLKGKLGYCGHVLFEPVRTIFFKSF